MSEPNPATSYSLLERLQSLDPVSRQKAQDTFSRRYREFIERQVRRFDGSLSEQDLEDLTQDVLVRVCEGVTQYFDGDRGRGEKHGRFRRWFATVIRREALELIRKRKALPEQAVVDDALLDGLADSDPVIERISEELRQYVLAKIREYVTEQAALDGARSMWRVFTLVDLEQRDPRTVAEMLGKTVSAITMGRHRVRVAIRAEFGDILDE